MFILGVPPIFLHYPTKIDHILSRASASRPAVAVSHFRVASQYRVNVKKSGRPRPSLGFPSIADKSPRTSSPHAWGLAHTRAEDATVVAAGRLPFVAAVAGGASCGASSAAT